MRLRQVTVRVRTSEKGDVEQTIIRSCVSSTNVFQVCQIRNSFCHDFPILDSFIFFLSCGYRYRYKADKVPKFQIIVVKRAPELRRNLFATPSYTPPAEGPPPDAELK